ncbi:hypothetical protein [Methylobacterium oxalidis]|uniref:hypothetical protein n=1 Tax=Methylobacterium oxalidis TaxID=944322 RepID=UPI00331642CF
MRIIVWKRAALAHVAGLGLVGLACAVWPVAAAQPTVQPPAAAPARNANPAPAAQPAAAPPGNAAPRVGERRRRNSYAACNRVSNQRGLRGGPRRRFLIRCRLGYERTRPAQGAPAQNPQPPGAQPPARRP